MQILQEPDATYINLDESGQRKIDDGTESEYPLPIGWSIGQTLRGRNAASRMAELPSAPFL